MIMLSFPHTAQQQKKIFHYEFQLPDLYTLYTYAKSRYTLYNGNFLCVYLFTHTHSMYICIYAGLQQYTESHFDKIWLNYQLIKEQNAVSVERSHTTSLLTPP
jgi:hypothetical protein